jgi:hypothetical protein
MTAETTCGRSRMKFNGFPLTLAHTTRSVTAESLWIVGDMDSPFDVSAEMAHLVPRTVNR